MHELLYPQSNQHSPFQLLQPMPLESSDSPLIEHLIAQRDRYQSQLDLCNQQATHARQQLAHINALLLDQFLPTVDLASIPSTTAQPNALAVNRQEPLDPPALPSGTPAPEINQLPKPTSEANSEPPKPAISAKAKPPAKKKRPGSPLQLSLLAPYSSMSKIAAVGQVLQAHRGSAVKPETIIQALYGELNAADQKAERSRMRAVLNQGVRKGLWNKSQGRGGAYTLEEPTPTSDTAVQEKPPSKPPRSQKPPKPKSKPSPKQTVAETAPGRGKVRGQSLIQQVIDVMLAHPREVMTSEAVAKEIFGLLPNREWAAIRKRISGIFSQGVKEGKWERVPNESGAYIYQ